MTIISFVDTETTGLDPDRHEIWEVALASYDTTKRKVVRNCVWQLPVDLGRADRVALDIGRFHDRRRAQLNDPAQFAAQFAELTWGTHLAGAVVSFDEERLRRLLRRHGQCPGWHYHLIDVEALAVGWLHGRFEDPVVPLPWRSDDLSAALGVEVAQVDRHTALGDVYWALNVYEAVTSPKEQR